MRMNNLLEQWNEHIIKGNHLSRELENIETLIEKSKGEDICFTSKPNGATYIAVLSPEKMQELRENAVIAILKTRDEKAAELEQLMGKQRTVPVIPPLGNIKIPEIPPLAKGGVIPKGKPAIINPEFEAAVQGMVDSVKKKPETPNDTVNISIPEEKSFAEPEPDPVEEKLTDVLQTEAKRIEQPDDKSLDKYPANRNVHKRLPEDMTEEAVYRMLVIEGKRPKEIAKHYNLTSTQVSNYIFQHDIRNYGKKNKLSAKQPQAETERP